MIDFIHTSTSNYGKVKLVLKKNRYFVECPFPEIMKTLLKDVAIARARILSEAVFIREVEDIAALEEKLGMSLSKQERSRLGVRSLKLFLEELLQKRYMDTVPLIIPLFEKEFWSASKKLNDINQEYSTLDEVKLKEKGRVFHDLFLTKDSIN